MPDIEIGSRALIGAGSVVVSDIEPGVVAAGNPAIVIKGISELSCPYGLIDRPYTE
jgi:maltose O-acetyltransferase